MMAGGVGVVLGWMLAPEWRITSVVLGFLAGCGFISLFILLLSSFFDSLVTSTNQQLIHLEDHLYGVDIDPQTFLQQSIELLIVDGPPGKTGPLARYPAVPLLKKWLHPGSIIILDDGYRDDEKKIAEKWAEELNANLEFYSSGKGSWILRI